MNPLVLKGSAGIAAFTAVLGTIGIVTKISKKVAVPIKTLLEKSRPDKRLLFAARGASNPDWKSAWNRYINQYKGTQEDPFALGAFSGENVPDNFMSKCESLFEEKVVDEGDDKYNLTLEFCTRNTLVSDFIWEQGKQMVSDKGNSSWSGLWNSYKQDGDLWQLNKSGNSGVPEEFKDRCLKESNSKSQNAHSPEVVAAVKYCSVVRSN
ncbi:hypothetical protein MHC_01570 [Mycoplasma haemocanis str. Illinois]|uniref:Uncharacterized protein n=1 Tax=Mycoplasma haemocanis (strain Illinois) TaxID=1111676 RepID=H6N6A8_MYCHN|nr:hypothetical protein [Mycoplasma haemocanis]AEW45180.1 hypothetical protein MHC_01570 [Mycoplasma haemocanis str. Illinois]